MIEMQHVLTQLEAIFQGNNIKNKLRILCKLPNAISHHPCICLRSKLSSYLTFLWHFCEAGTPTMYMDGCEIVLSKLRNKTFSVFWLSATPTHVAISEYIKKCCD